jgi:hypothetical protein
MPEHYVEGWLFPHVCEEQHESDGLVHFKGLLNNSAQGRYLTHSIRIATSGEKQNVGNSPANGSPQHAHLRRWEWRCGFYPGSNPGEHQSGTSATFDEARADFESAWKIFLSKRTEADFQEWRDQRDWTAEKYRRFDRGERMPHNWRASASPLP